MRHLVVVLALTSAVVACGGADGTGGAEQFLTDTITAASLGQFDRNYDRLHPSQRDLFTRADYVRCAEAQSSGYAIDELEVLDTYESRTEIPGTSEEVDAVQVSMRLTIAGENFTDTFAAIDVDGEWHYVVANPADYNC